MNSRTLASVSGQMRRPALSWETKGLSLSAIDPNCHWDRLCSAQNVSMSWSSVLIDTAYKLDTSNGQRWNCPPFAKKEDSSNIALMDEIIDIDTIRDSLKRIMLRKKVKPTTLSLQVGTNRTLVKNLLETTGDVTISTLTKLAGALDVPVSELLSSRRVSIVGYIGAGGEIIFEDMGQEETVLRPPGISGTLIALLVRGSSMLPKYKDGDVIYIQRQHEGILPDYIGEDCAVRLTTGETYIKQIIQGSEDGLFTLLSLNAPPIENVEIEWATPVIFIMPARSRHILT